MKTEKSRNTIKAQVQRSTVKDQIAKAGVKMRSGLRAGYGFQDQNRF